MWQKRLSMRKIRELLRLKYELGRSHREIAMSLGIANSTVNDYTRRAVAAGFSWPLPDGLGLSRSAGSSACGCDDAASAATLRHPARSPRHEVVVPRLVLGDGCSAGGRGSGSGTCREEQGRGGLMRARTCWRVAGR